ncbi:DUF4192 domain-containing protein [Kutzneria chonburiensis]|uniref:DUF4192 domain-containing protein n=1 Tax=Kutzneria chonburiensis TaxID=1483604 RepID=A0ABV6MYH0_9PSEU|nr:DUF4192 domain-containing protein [Kutzneria chonburiensis]
MHTAAHPDPDHPDQEHHPDEDHVVRLADIGELAAAIPSLLGFHPEGSLIAVTMRGDGLIGPTARIDLAPPSLYSGLVASLVRSLRQTDARIAVLFVVCEQADPRHEDLIRRAFAALTRISVSVWHAIGMPSAEAGVRWRCYLHDDCEGEVPDSSASEFAAAVVQSGLVTFDRREDLVRQLEPPDLNRTIKLADLLDTAIRSDRTTSAEHLAVLRDAIAAATLPTTDEEFVRFGLALSDYRVRDVCLRYALDSKEVPAAERLWLELTRSLPPPERAEAAVLLGVSAYMRGDGAMANIALEEAWSVQPGHSLAGLLYGAISYGVPMEQLRLVLTDAAVDAQIDIDGDRDSPEASDMSP